MQTQLKKAWTSSGTGGEATAGLGGRGIAGLRNTLGLPQGVPVQQRGIRQSNIQDAVKSYQTKLKGQTGLFGAGQMGEYITQIAGLKESPFADPEKFIAKQAGINVKDIGKYGQTKGVQQAGQQFTALATLEQQLERLFEVGKYDLVAIEDNIAGANEKIRNIMTLNEAVIKQYGSLSEYVTTKAPGNIRQEQKVGLGQTQITGGVSGRDEALLAGGVQQEFVPTAGLEAAAQEDPDFQVLLKELNKLSGGKEERASQFAANKKIQAILEEVGQGGTTYEELMEPVQKTVQKKAEMKKQQIKELDKHTSEIKRITSRTMKGVVIPFESEGSGSVADRNRAFKLI